jgi:signal recognition particle GTPase
MPENAGRKFGKGELYQHNVLNLVKALLRLAKGNLTLDDSQLKAAVQVAWLAQNKLEVTGEYKETTKRGERVFEGTTKQDLWQLVEKTGTPLQLPQRQRDDASTSAASRQADVVQNALYYLEDLGVLQNERPKNKRNTRYWIFTLTLKHRDASIEENLGVVKQKLGLEMLPPTDKSIDWQNVCRTMLEKQKQLTTNRLMRADEMLFDIDRIRVDLALVERKQTEKRSEDDNPARSQLYKPDYEETQKLEYEDFLTKVLKSEQSKKIAIIGEPGAGKTTLLQRIAFWILENTDDLPIWIPLGNFPNPAPKFKDSDLAPIRRNP